MQSSDPNSTSPSKATEPPLTGKQLPLIKRFRRFWPLFAILFTLLGVWMVKYRGTGWSNLFNPAYWYHRSRGDDLYNTDEALLLHGNRTLPEVALTFDDGPHPESRGEILDILKKAGVHATFFDVGVNMALHPELIERTLAEGNEIGNHSQTHPAERLIGLDRVSRHRQINDVDITFAAITGKHLSILRPPGMRYNAAVLAETRRLGYIVVGYTTASNDFDPNESADLIAQRTLDRTENGSIVLLHDYASTARALPAILADLQARGLHCVTISELMAHLPTKPRTAAVSFQKAHAE